MSKILEVTIKSLHTVLKSELPDNAVLARPIITTDTLELYIGTGLDKPLMRMEELIIVDSISDLTDDIASTLKIYIAKDKNFKYFYDGTQYVMIEGLGILDILEHYSDLPATNNVEGFFAINSDETNNNLAGVYFYNKTTNTYGRLASVSVSNTIYNFKVQDIDVLATNFNNTLNINSGRLMDLKVDNSIKTITFNQKASIDVEMEIKTYSIKGGTKTPIPVAYDCGNIAAVDGKIYFFNGRSSSVPTNVIYVYDESTNTWSNLGITTPFNKCNMCTHDYNHKIYLHGGFYTNGSVYYSYNNLYVFDPIDNSFTELTHSTKKGHSIHSAVVNDKLWLLGGGYYSTTSSSSFTATPTIEYYDFYTDTWTILPATCNMPFPTDGGAVFVVGSKIHCVGGYHRATATYQNIHQVFDTDTLTWTTKAAYPGGTYYGMQGVGVNELGYVMGGHPDGYSTSSACYVYVSESDVWIQRQNMSTNRTNTKCVYLNGCIYSIAGGYYWNDGWSEYTRITTVDAYGLAYDTEDKDYEVFLRSPQKIQGTSTVSNLLNNVNADLSRNTTLEAGKYWEYGDWKTTGTVEVLVKRFNY